MHDVTSPAGGDQPAVEFHAHGTVLTGDEAFAAWNKEVDKAQADNRKVLACMTAFERRRFAAYLRTRVAKIIPTGIRGARAQAAPRGRREGSSSRSSGQDPGDDDPAPSSPFEPLHPLPAIRGQLSLWGYEPRIGGRR